MTHPTTQPSEGAISEALVRRMVELVRALSDVPKDTILGQSGYACEARAIAAALPKPISPDLIEARELYIEAHGGIDADDEIVTAARSGSVDDSDLMRALLKALTKATGKEGC